MMTTKTRYFVIVSLLVLTVGVGTGLLAYYTGFATSAAGPAGGPKDLQFIPSNASLIAYADVAEIMSSPLREKLRGMLPMRPDGQQEFQDRTGINIETDIDHVVVGLVAPRDGAPSSGSMIVVARGRFDAVKIEALMREHGAQVETYKDIRLLVASTSSDKPDLSLAFFEPGVVGVGTSALIRNAVDLKSGGANITTNDDMMSRLRELEAGNAWAVGHFAALASQAHFPSGVSQNLPAVTWFSASAMIDSGLRGSILAETRDDESANGLRDVIRGIIAFANLQASARPEFKTLLQSLELGGTGNTVALSFSLSGELIDALGGLASRHQLNSTPAR